jgi:integrase
LLLRQLRRRNPATCPVRFRHSWYSDRHYLGTGFFLTPPVVLTRSFARLVQRLGLKNLTFHDLRHDAASTLAMEGVPLRRIAEILGHRDLRMTARYAHLSPQHLRDAMQAL